MGSIARSQRARTHALSLRAGVGVRAWLAHVSCSCAVCTLSSLLLACSWYGGACKFKCPHTERLNTSKAETRIDPAAPKSSTNMHVPSFLCYHTLAPPHLFCLLVLPSEAHTRTHHELTRQVRLYLQEVHFIILRYYSDYACVHDSHDRYAWGRRSMTGDQSKVR